MATSETMESILDQIEPIYPGKDYETALIEDLLSLLIRMKNLAPKIQDPEAKKQHLDWCRVEEEKLREAYSKRQRELSEKNKLEDDEPIEDLRKIMAGQMSPDEVLDQLT